jgi:hypothetical protein
LHRAKFGRQRLRSGPYCPNIKPGFYEAQIEFIYIWFFSCLVRLGIQAEFFGTVIVSLIKVN